MDLADRPTLAELPLADLRCSTTPFVPSHVEFRPRHVDPSTSNGEPLKCKVLPGAIQQEVFSRVKTARHVAVDEPDPDACIHRRLPVFSSENLADRIGVDEPLRTKPPHNTTAHLLRERGQISLKDWPGQQLSVACGFAFALLAKEPATVTGRYEDAVGHARTDGGARSD